MNMSSGGKISKSDNSRGPKTRSEKSTIGHHNERLMELEKEHAMLEGKRTQGMFTNEDEAKIATIEMEMKKYAGTMTQMNLNPAVGTIPESSAAVERDTAGQDLTGQAGTEQHDATEYEATEQNVAEQNTTVNAPDPVKTHANAQESPSKQGKIKIEPMEKSKVSTNRYVDDLSMAWDVDVSDTHVELALQNQNQSPQQAIRIGSLA
jgi:hypothetical protein